jgi:UDP-N-acetylglucosamine transferase subunit ALG13
VGNATQGFQRLLEVIERLASEGFFQGETVLIQSGNNPDFKPSYCQHKPFLTLEEFEAKIQHADLIICHAGAGTLFHVLQAGKVPVVIPRRKKYGEIVDDHQVELIEVLAPQGRIIPAYEPEDIPNAIEQARGRNLQQIPLPTSPMLPLVAEAIEELLRHKA